MPVYPPLTATATSDLPVFASDISASGFGGRASSHGDTFGSIADSSKDEEAKRETKEYIVVCIDRSEVTVNVVDKAVAERTRMEAVKAMFYAFRDRVESVGRGTHQMGLVQFDIRVERLLELTPRLDRFEAIVDDMEKRGLTAIYSSIIEAVGMLEKHFHEGCEADFRILVLSDGKNNC